MSLENPGERPARRGLRATQISLIQLQKDGSDCKNLEPLSRTPTSKFRTWTNSPRRILEPYVTAEEEEEEEEAALSVMESSTPVSRTVKATSQVDKPAANLDGYWDDAAIFPNHIPSKQKVPRTPKSFKARLLSVSRICTFYRSSCSSFSPRLGVSKHS
jgi:hypothetical protein